MVASHGSALHLSHESVSEAPECHYENKKYVTNTYKQNTVSINTIKEVNLLETKAVHISEQ